MLYNVSIKRRTEKGLTKLPRDIQAAFYYLLNDLMESGPFQKSWKNYSPLGDNKYHCHLNYSYVACWKWYKNTIEIEVYYAGSRESAPY